MLLDRLAFNKREAGPIPPLPVKAGSTAGVVVHLVMPWFFPLATIAAWLGVRAARDLRSEGEAGRRNAWWMLVLMALPLFFWLIAQFTSGGGIYP